MHDHSDHTELIKQVAEEYKEILDNSKQGIYIYLDDNNKITNDKFASMLGYTKEEWEKPSEFIETFVSDTSAHELVSAFQSAMEDMVGSNLSVTWKKKGADVLATNVILVPIMSQGHVLALHFVTEA